jgi:chemotaxis protein MotA
VEIATPAGIVIGWGALLAAMLLDGMRPNQFANVSALVLVVGGTAGATVASFFLPQVLGAARVARQVTRRVSAPSELIERLVAMSRVAAREGLLKLEASLGEIEDPFVRRAIQLVIDGAEAEELRRQMEAELELVEERHRIGERIFTTAAGFAPTLGIIGTVVGLINMLRELTDPSRIGPAIATAFLATLYGVALANLLLLPMANKLKAKHEQEALIMRAAVEGAILIATRVAPTLVRDRLLVYLPPAERARALAGPASPPAGAGPGAGGAEGAAPAAAGEGAALP